MSRSSKIHIALIGIVYTLVMLLVSVALTGCNRTIVDTTYSFNRAIIEDIGEVDVAEWTDYDDSDMVQIKDKVGNVYLTHSSKVILIKDKK